MLNTCKIIEFKNTNIENTIIEAAAPNPDNVIILSNVNNSHDIKSIIENFKRELEIFQTAQTTIENYSIFLNRFIKDNKIKTSQDLQQLQEYPFYTNYIEFLQNNNIINSTINNRLSMLSTFIKFLIRNNILESNIIKHIPKLPEAKKVVTYLEDQQIQIVINAMQQRVDMDHKRKIDKLNAYREYVMVALMVTLGIRVSECCNVLVDDVNMDAGTIAIRGKGYRGDVSRVLDIPESIYELMQGWEEIREQIEVDYDSQEFYFISALTKKNVKRLSIEKRLKLIGEEIGIDMLHPHLLRHSFGTNNVHDERLSVREVSEILGHSNVSTTEKFYISQDRKALAKTRYSGSQFSF